MASVLDDEISIQWIKAWSNDTQMLNGLRPFTASIWNGQMDDGGYKWRVEICGMKFKKGYDTPDQAKRAAEKLLRHVMHRGVEHMTKYLEEHEEKAPVKRRRPVGLEGK